MSDFESSRQLQYAHMNALSYSNILGTSRSSLQTTRMLTLPNFIHVPVIG